MVRDRPGSAVARQGCQRPLGQRRATATPAAQTNFVLGPWKAKYGLGTYGIDPASHTAWAVVNYDGSFAVSNHFLPLLFPRGQAH